MYSEDLRARANRETDPAGPSRNCLVKSTLGLAMAALLVLGLGLGSAQADDLDDKAAALAHEHDHAMEAAEFLDKDIAASLAKLEEYQGQLPAAQQALTAAQGRVADAANNVSALGQRVALAQETRDKITQQLERDKAQLEGTRRTIGQIATQAYKSGGVPSNISLFLGSKGADSLTNSMDLADQALRSQAAAMDKLAQQNATNENSSARLEAVEGEIRDLKAKADAALAAEQGARDDAAARKATVDALIADSSALSAQLQAKKPAIQAQLAQVAAEQATVQNEIADRQRRQLEEQRARDAAAAAAAAAAGRQAPAAPQAGPVSAFGLNHPVPANVPITSGFGWRSTPAGTIDFNGTGGYMHTGIDFGAACGTPLYAPAPGEIWYADQAIPSAGNRIVIDHGVVQGNTLATNYYHLSRLMVSKGQHVNRGDLIGYTGTTGNSTGCHLHFETMLNGELVDPMRLL